jgi:predicted ester cyclase
MGTTGNVDAVRRLEAAYGARDYEAVRSILATDVACHTPGSEMMPAGVEGCVAANEGGFSAYPDKVTEILDIFGEGDRVVSHVRMTGTNQGGLPWMGIEPNGNAIDTDWIQISRHADDGTILETWAQMDTPKMLVQLGAMPAPEGM